MLSAVCVLSTVCTYVECCVYIEYTVHTMHMIHMLYVYCQVLDDPCGNSFIENLCAPSDDPQLIVESYQRSHEQDIMLGIQSVYIEISPSL